MSGATPPAGAPRRGNRAVPLAVAAGVALLVAAAWWFSPDRAPGPAPTGTPARPATAAELLVAERTRGDAGAPVTIIEFSDFQCPFCRVFWNETMATLEREYVQTGKARFVFLNLPIASIHRHATQAHEFAMCAAAQRRFWPYHDLLYRHQERWARLPDATAFFQHLADSAALDPRALTQCLDAGSVRGIIENDLASARGIGVASTPSFLVDRLLITGAVTMDTWRPILDSIYAAKRDEGRGTRDE